MDENDDMIRYAIPLLFFIGTCAKAQGISIDIGTYQDHQKAIQLATTHDDCPSLEQVNLGENQVLAEYMIFCHALKLSPNTYQISLLSYPNNGRMLNDVEDSRIEGTAIGIWRNEARENILVISPALLRNNEFEKGLYTTKEVLANTVHRSQLNTSMTLANQNWYHDWEIMKCAGMKLLHVSSYEQMFNMIKLGRGKFVPITFGPNANLERNQFGVALYPFPDLKLVFADSTHFVINGKSEKGKQLLADLALGLAQLRVNGDIENVYRRIGIINPRVAQWKPLSCQGASGRH
ncbi:hypothetical protein OPS25_07290 [Alteromonas ponticola]|uniref:Solute-binding protein family 3/N-terminal domain-containing protein n=1 Tax=Alteromonas aquimaris TaxID=2998417 RepID=A0ABT3P699_9ALTE|nr:hypothetical protein [Alteromonas aquimaris]MCW8108295.1 hypothetical protein [Alteromonas aquimaris]